MQYETTAKLITDVYSAFGRTPKREIIDAVFRKCDYIPDEASSFIRDKIEEFDVLPQNLGKAVSTVYSSYLNEHSEETKIGCSHCRSGWLRFFDKKNPMGFLTKCPYCSGGNAALIERYRKFCIEMPLSWKGTDYAYGVKIGLIQQTAQANSNPYMPNFCAERGPESKKKQIIDILSRSVKNDVRGAYNAKNEDSTENDADFIDF